VFPRETWILFNIANFANRCSLFHLPRVVSVCQHTLQSAVSDYVLHAVGLQYRIIFEVVHLADDIYIGVAPMWWDLFSVTDGSRSESMGWFSGSSGYITIRSWSGDIEEGYCTGDTISLFWI